MSTSNGLVLVDLHSLSVRLALEVVAVLVDLPLETGGAVLITGRGKHTGGHSKLRAAVLADLEARQDAVEVRPLGPGRVELVFDPDRVRAARPGMGALFWLFVLLLLLAVVAVVLNRV